MATAKIILEDGLTLTGTAFGYPTSVTGEVVFNTAMTGYPESLSDPSYKGQILVMTYPLIGNYGIPSESVSENNMPVFFESDDIHISALIVTDYTEEYSHWRAEKSLDEWLKEHKIPAIYGIDTRQLTKHLRQKGVMLGKVVYENQDIEIENPLTRNLVAEVSCKEKMTYGNGKHKITLVDCGVKFNIIRDLIANDATVTRVPWDYDFTNDDYDGLFISNGPGDPSLCVSTIEHLKKAMQQDKPIMGICLGNQIMGLAAGAKTFKLPYGHRSHNQPVKMEGTQTAFITAQNHSYAIDTKTLPSDWTPYYTNLNDGTNEGIRHKSKPFFSAQFHPEASGGATDTEYMFESFIDEVKRYKESH